MVRAISEIKFPHKGYWMSFHFDDQVKRLRTISFVLGSLAAASLVLQTALLTAEANVSPLLMSYITLGLGGASGLVFRRAKLVGTAAYWDKKKQKPPTRPNTTPMEDP